MSAPTKRAAAPQIDRHTARPVAAYARAQAAGAPIAYVAEFSKALGLKPALTDFGARRARV